MGFDIITPNLPEKMYPGMIITYKVRPLPVMKTTWVTEITQLQEGTYFVDEQRVGPYKMWHHQHWITPVKGGVHMKDIVTYQPPYGILGTMANYLFIRKKLNEIFAYRTAKLESLFGKMPESVNNNTNLTG
jgi:ligand-binding SRPBCC domain-containing protein